MISAFRAGFKRWNNKDLKVDENKLHDFVNKKIVTEWFSRNI